MQIEPLRAGLIAGLFLAVIHAAWALLVMVGWAQWLMNFVFWAHFITPVYHIESFEAGRAATLIGIVFVAGAAMGWVAALLWNNIGRRSS